MSHVWRDKVVLVTGGSAGLGRAIGAAFASRKAKVVLAARGEDALQAAVEAIHRAGGEALATPTDVTQDGQVEALVAGVIERCGRLDVLVNCAGASMRKEALAASVEDFRQAMDLNFYAAVRCTRAAAPHLIESRGHLVNIGSLSSKVATRYMGAYPASKFALAAYSQQLRLELGEKGLHVLLVCPGPIARDKPHSYDDEQNAGLPESAKKPGGGAKLREIDPQDLARRIVQACERRKPELIVPAKARLLFLVQQLSARWGDYLIKKMT